MFGYVYPCYNAANEGRNRLTGCGELAMRVIKTDVVVVGSGLAGISAAVEAARAGARVALLTAGTLCEGSSFSPHTWGLGMVSPLDLESERSRDEQSLSFAMESVGAHQNKPQLVDALMEDAEPAISFLESLGATVSTPDNPGEQAYVPCFDTRVRGWHGFHAWNSREEVAFTVQSIEAVRVYEHTHALSLVQPHGVGTPVSGVVAVTGSAITAVLVRFEAPSVVLATGGLAGVYTHSFGGCALGAAMAHDAGAVFTNLEFLQLMMGFLSYPYGTICNEKLWRWSTVTDERGQSVFSYVAASPEDEREALEAHSWHGPFTTARPSRLLELAVQAAVAQGHRSYLKLSDKFLAGAHPEFVDTYLSWLREKGVDPTKPVEIGLFAHSSNGGIAIDAHGATNVAGLFAAGECAGGVHGADRIGGLASVAALVFGRRAGVAAARHAREHTAQEGARLALPFCTVDEPAAVRRQVGNLMTNNCMVNRTAEGLRSALDELDVLEQTHLGQMYQLDDGPNALAALQAANARSSIVAARLMTQAMLARSENMGSHHRADVPERRA